jgi:DNA-directed RNA polymerase subunit H (RpoH/RPB5)
MVYIPDQSWIRDKYPGAQLLLDFREIALAAYCGGAKVDIVRAISHHSNLLVANPSIACVDVDRKELLTFLEDLSPDLRKWFFSMEELSFDPTRHPMVPYHRIATPQEIESLSEHFGSDFRNMLPILDSCDIIARWNGFSIGAIIAIERPCDNEPFLKDTNGVMKDAGSPNRKGSLKRENGDPMQEVYFRIVK